MCAYQPALSFVSGKQEFTQMPTPPQDPSTFPWPDLGHLVIPGCKGVWKTENAPKEIKSLMVRKRENGCGSLRPDHPDTSSLPFSVPIGSWLFFFCWLSHTC